MGHIGPMVPFDLGLMAGDGFRGMSWRKLAPLFGALLRLPALSAHEVERGREDLGQEIENADLPCVDYMRALMDDQAHGGAGFSIALDERIEA